MPRTILAPSGGSGGSGGAPTTALYVTLATDGTLSQERVLTAGTTGAGLVVTDAGAGSTVTVDIKNERWAVVAADVTKNASAVLGNVTGLALTIGSSATEVWQFECQLLTVAANITADWQFGWTFPAGCTMFWAPHIVGAAAATSYFDPLAPAGTQNALLIQTTVASYGSGAVSGAFFYRGWIFGGGTGGSVQLQFAQNTSNASNSTIKKGSFMLARKVIA